MIREVAELLTIQRKGQKSAKEDGESKATMRQQMKTGLFLQTTAEELEVIHPP